MMNLRSTTETHGREVAVAAVFAAVAAALGLLAGSAGLLSVAAVVALVAAVVFLRHPFVGLLMVALTIPVDNVVALGPGVTANKLLGVAVVVAWLLRKLVLRESWRPLLSSRLFLAATAFAMLALVSVFWAVNPMTVRSGAFQLLLVIGLAFLILDLIDSWERADALVKALVIGGTIAAGFTVWQAAIGGARRAGGDVGGGVNETAIILLTLLPFGFYMFRAARGSGWKALGIVYSALGAAAIVLTYSRFNLMLLVPVLGILLWLTWRDGRGRGWLLGLVAMAAVAGAILIPWEDVEERVSTIGPYIQSAFEASEGGAEENAGRAYHLKVGLAIFGDHPLIGAGYGNYGELFRTRYQFEVRGAGKLFTSNRSAHSSHVAILADLGLVGMFAWLLVLGVALVNVFGAWAATGRDARAPPHIMVQALSIGVVLHATAYGLYTPNHTSKLMWALVGLTAVVMRLSEIRTRARAARMPWPSARGAVIPAGRGIPVSASARRTRR